MMVLPPYPLPPLSIHRLDGFALLGVKARKIVCHVIRILCARPVWTK